MINPCVQKLVVLATLLAIWTGQAVAAELVMFERAGCPYCARFDREVAPIYPLTAEGRTAPLRRVDIHRPIPRDLDFIKVERITPVFVLIDHGREIGRIRGYSGEDHFWGLFAGLAEQLRRSKGPAVN